MQTPSPSPRSLSSKGRFSKSSTLDRARWLWTTGCLTRNGKDATSTTHLPESFPTMAIAVSERDQCILWGLYMQSLFIQLDLILFKKASPTVDQSSIFI